MKKWQSTIGWVSVAVALLAAGAVPGIAAAAADAGFDARPAAGYRVFVADLDLQSASGVAALYSRLRTAARAVCGFDQARGYAERQRARRCTSATLDAVVADVGRGTFVSRRLNTQHRGARNRMMDTEAVDRLVTSSR